MTATGAGENGDSTVESPADDGDAEPAATREEASKETPAASPDADLIRLEESDFESRGRTRTGIRRRREKGLLGSYARVEKWTPQWERGRGGTIIGISLVGIFGAFLGIVLVGAIVVVAISPSPESAQIYATVLTNVLEATGNFAASVFGPLLAFVLGYYFGEKNRETVTPQETDDLVQ